MRRVLSENYLYLPYRKQKSAIKKERIPIGYPAIFADPSWLVKAALNDLERIVPYREKLGKNAQWLKSPQQSVSSH
jgi:hypothetical protein